MSKLTDPLPDGYVHGRPFWTIQQRECFIKSLPLARFCIWKEPRCGKTDPVIAKTCYYFERKSHPLHVTGLLVIAFPNGVHRGWISDAFPENIPARIKWKGHIWRSDKCRQVGFRAAFDEVCKTNRLAVFAVNAEALGSIETRTAIGKFLAARTRVHVVFDESSALAHSDAQRSRVMFNIGRATQYVKLMTVLDGTPVDRNGPLDYYSQIGWMGLDILGYDNEVEFRKRYAEIVTKGRAPFWRKVKALEGKGHDKETAIRLAKKERVPDEADLERVAKLVETMVAGGTVPDTAETRRLKLSLGDGLDGIAVAEAAAKSRPVKRGRDWWTVVDEDEDGRPKYRNMDELWTKMDPISYRATFAECFPDSKRQVFQKRYFQLTAKQRKVYADLQKKYRVEIDGKEFKAEHPLTRLLRSQQITSNYYPDAAGLIVHDRCAGLGCEDCGDSGVIETDSVLRVIDTKENPRLDALRIELFLGRPAGVWARFRPDVDSVIALAKSMGILVCRYDGAAGHDEKADSREGFQSGKYDLIVGNQVSLSRGIPLYRAEVLYGYSNLFSFRTRRQVEERAEHGSKKTATAIVDLVAEQTVDDLSIIPALRAGMDVSSWVLRDQQREWI